MAQNLYLILGVAPDADPQQITRAYRQLIRTLHPDAASEAPAAGDPPARERFEQVVAAYHVLHDPAARASYDRALAAAASTADRRPAPGAHLVDGGGRAPLVAGPTVINARPAAGPDPAIRVGPPMRLSD